MSTLLCIGEKYRRSVIKLTKQKKKLATALSTAVMVSTLSAPISFANRPSVLVMPAAVTANAADSAQQSGYYLGDVNGNGRVDVADVVLLQKWLLAAPDAYLPTGKQETSARMINLMWLTFVS